MCDVFQQLSQEAVDSHAAHVSCRVDTEEWMAAVEVLLSKSSEACQWMVQFLVGPEGREIIRSVAALLMLVFCCFLALKQRLCVWRTPGAAEF